MRTLAPPGEKTLYRFASPEDLAAWTVFSDQQFGGTSTASLSLAGSSGDAEASSSDQPNVQHDHAAIPRHAVLAGHYSTKLAEGAVSAIQRSGFCGMHTKVIK